MKRLRHIVLLLAAVAAALLVAEGVARLVHEPEPVRRVYDPFAHRIPQPGLVDTFTGRDGEPVTVRLNELGMRGPSIAEDVAPGTLTLVFLGGSTTENYAYRREDTFPELVGRAVAERTGRPVRVLNAGMSSATAATSLGRLQHQVLDLEPDLVVVMHGVNDLLWGFHPDFRADGRHLTRPPTADARPRSYLVDALRRPRPQPAYEPDFELHDFEDFAARRVFERNLRSMAAVASAHGVPLLFMTQASMYELAEDERFVLQRSLAGLERRPDAATLARGMAAMNATTRLVAGEWAGRGVHLDDLAARLPRDWDHFYDECHFTRRGNTRVASELASGVTEVLTLHLGVTVHGGGKGKFRRLSIVRPRPGTPRA